MKEIISVCLRNELKRVGGNKQKMRLKILKNWIPINYFQIELINHIPLEKIKEVPNSMVVVFFNYFRSSIKVDVCFWACKKISSLSSLNIFVYSKQQTSFQISRCWIVFRKEFLVHCWCCCCLCHRYDCYWNIARQISIIDI